ncbi:hypothetical protein IG631_23592 [Alternaria alternata]|nr:hypothetical protein IG631_23592 [Alternaria alternata]
MRRVSALAFDRLANSVAYHDGPGGARAICRDHDGAVGTPQETEAHLPRKRRRYRNPWQCRNADAAVDERDGKRREQAQSRGPESAPTERRTTCHDSRLASLEQQGQDETAPAGGSDYRAPTRSHGGLAVQPSSNTSASRSWNSPTMAECTSPFEDGYALLKGGPVWDCTETASTRKHEGT